MYRSVQVQFPGDAERRVLFVGIEIRTHSVRITVQESNERSTRTN